MDGLVIIPTIKACKKAAKMHWFDSQTPEEKLKIQQCMDKHYKRIKAKPEDRMAEEEMKRLLKKPRKQPTYRR